MFCLIPSDHQDTKILIIVEYENENENAKQLNIKPKQFIQVLKQHCNWDDSRQMATQEAFLWYAVTNIWWKSAEIIYSKPTSPKPFLSQHQGDTTTNLVCVLSGKQDDYQLFFLFHLDSYRVDHWSFTSS